MQSSRPGRRGGGVNVPYKDSFASTHTQQTVTMRPVGKVPSNSIPSHGVTNSRPLHAGHTHLLSISKKNFLIPTTCTNKNNC